MKFRSHPTILNRSKGRFELTRYILCPKLANFFLQHVDEELENEEPDEMQNETPATDDMALAWPPTAFNLPGTSSEC